MTTSPARIRRTLLLAAASATLWAAGSLQAQTFLFDFGAAGTTTTNGAAPDDPLRFWNNVTDSIGTSNTGQLLDVVTSTNLPSDIDLLMVSRFNGSNTNGTLTSTLYPTDATRDSLYGNTEVFNGLTNVTPIFKLASLDPTKSYNFTFYASRVDATQPATANRETVYSIQGGVSGSVALDALNNVNNSVTYSGMTPNAAGEITISLLPGPNNNNANHFIYLGVMELVAVPEPSAAVMLTLAGVALCSRRRRPTSAA